MAPPDASTATAAPYLPRDVLSDILLRLPAFHLRGLRHVCKEWHAVISSLADAYTVHGRRVPTHTVVFSPGSAGTWWPFIKRLGCGFLFDEHWGSAARFTVDVSARLIGTCNSLLFFLVEDDDVIKVVEPFTGESIAVPLSPARYAKRSASAYCLGFDSRTRQYKIVHGLYNCPLGKSKTETVEQDLYVFTVGADKEWRTLRFACALHGYSYHVPAVCGDGAVYWRGETADGILKYARFDLTTEEITSVDARLVVVGRMPVRRIGCRYTGAVSSLCDIQISWFGEWDDGCWPHNITALPHEIFEVGLGQRRLLPRRHALQRGHLLLQDKDGSLYAHEIQSSNTCTTELYLGREKLLIEIGQMEEEPTEWYKFVPVHGSHQQRNKPVAAGSSQIDAPVVAKFSYEHRSVSTFAYTPTLYLTSARST